MRKPEAADRSRREAYPMEVLTLDAGRTSYLSAEEPKSAKGFLALSSPKSAQGAPLGTPRRQTRERSVR